MLFASSLRTRTYGWPAAGLILVCCLFPVLAESLPEQREDPAQITYREAYDAGFDDGQRIGREDRAQNRLFDLANKKLFQEARRGFEETRHDPEVYTVAYRRGFEDGYGKGYGVEEAGDASSPNSPASAPPPARKAYLKTATDLPSTGNTLPAGTEFKIELLDTLSTKYNERGDLFGARLVEDVPLGGGLVIPEGSHIQGRIAYLKRAGRIRGRAQLNLRFEKLQLLDGRSATIEANVVGIEPKSREQLGSDEGTLVGGASKAGDARTIGTASAVGSIIGLISGGKSGAGVGAAAGAVAGLANVLMTRGRDAQLESRTRLTIRLINEATLVRSDPQPAGDSIP